MNEEQGGGKGGGKEGLASVTEHLHCFSTVLLELQETPLGARWKEERIK